VEKVTDQQTRTDASVYLKDSPSAAAARRGIVAGTRAVLRVVLGTGLTVALMVVLVAVGLYAAPTIGIAALPDYTPPRQSPIIPPSVPLGAREEWAVWSYLDKINRAWGKDWPLVIQWFEELYARYPHNAMAQDKLYVAYLEDGRTLEFNGDYAGARRRYEQATRFDPDRGEAWEFLERLDKAGR